MKITMQKGEEKAYTDCSRITRSLKSKVATSKLRLMVLINEWAETASFSDVPIGGAYAEA